MTVSSGSWSSAGLNAQRLTLFALQAWGAENTCIVNCKDTLSAELRQYGSQAAIVWQDASAEWVLRNRGLNQSGTEACRFLSCPT